MDYYTVWAHSLYPRLQFRDFSRKVLNGTQSARVKVNLEYIIYHLVKGYSHELNPFDYY